MLLTVVSMTLRVLASRHDGYCTHDTKKAREAVYARRHHLKAPERNVRQIEGNGKSNDPPL